MGLLLAFCAVPQANGITLDPASAPQPSKLSHRIDSSQGALQLATENLAARGSSPLAVSSLSLTSEDEATRPAVAVPLPASVWLFLSALVGFVLVSRQRQQKS